MAAAIILSAFLYLILPNNNVVWGSNWLNETLWHPKPGIVIFVSNLLLLDDLTSHSFDGVIWSLTIEVRLSLIFPLILLAVNRYGIKACIASFILSMAMQFIHRHHGPDKFIDIDLTLSYLWLFAAGAQLAKQSDKLGKVRLGFLEPCILLICALLLATRPERFYGVLVGVGSIGAIAVVTTSGALTKVLNWSELIYLGSISYSLYLVHLPVSIFITHLLPQTVHPIWVLFACAIISFCVAHAFYMAVELPFIRMSRALPRRKAV